MQAARLLALSATHGRGCRIGLLALALLREELGLQEVVGFWGHERVGEACTAMLHADLLVGLLLELLGPLQLHVGRMLLRLLLKIVLIERCTSDHTFLIRDTHTTTRKARIRAKFQSDFTVKSIGI